MTINTPTITHIVLDIEGTTCPVDYVTGTLFPYASRAAQGYLESMTGNNEINDLVGEILTAWENDPSPEAKNLLTSRAREPMRAVIPYLQWLIKNDRKLTALKTLQGKIWDMGYRQGELVAPIFNDVAATLGRWRTQNIKIGSYSSGSIQAQKLLYQYSTEGDLCPLFNHWFDTTIGSKKDSSSYSKICSIINAKPSNTVFISDITAELFAAEKAGMKSYFSRRKGNPEISAGPFQAIETLKQIPV